MATSYCSASLDAVQLHGYTLGPFTHAIITGEFLAIKLIPNLYQWVI